jgi:hypothetical protein
VRAFLFFVLLTCQALACSSDCYQCHKVPKDSYHKLLSTCTECHREHPEESRLKACGSDCFDCHDYKKVMELSRAHKVLKECVKCHKSLKKKALPDALRSFLGGGS